MTFEKTIPRAEIRQNRLKLLAIKRLKGETYQDLKNFLRTLNLSETTILSYLKTLKQIEIQGKIRNLIN